MKKSGIFILVITFTCIAVVLMVSLQFLPVEKLLRTPKPYGENELIQEVFEQSVDSKYTLKNIEFGNNYAAYNFADIDNDGEDEVIITYCESEKGDNIKICLLDKRADQWSVITNISTKFSEIEFVKLINKNNDGNNHIVVGMSDEEELASKHMYICEIVTKQGNIDINLCYESDYSGIDISDINTDGNSEIIIVDIADSQDRYNLSVLEHSAEGFKPISSVDVNESLDTLLSVKTDNDFDGNVKEIYLYGYISENTLSTFCYAYNTEVNELYEIINSDR